MSPVRTVSDQFRLPRSIKLRLGVKAPNRVGGGEHPEEVDFFVVDRDEAADPKLVELIRDHYGKQPKALRMMLPLEWDTLNPANDDEVVFNLNNRAYGSGYGLRCKGHGNTRTEPDVAETSDAEWARRIGQATGQPERRLPNGRWLVQCWGRDCVKYLVTDDRGKKLVGGAEGHDPDQACKRYMVLRAYLLYPASDPKDENYCRPLCIAEVASGSWNSTIDVASGLKALRLFTGGRTAAVPFTLRRRPTHTYRPAKTLHFPIVVEFDPREVSRMALLPPHQVFVDAAYQAEVLALRQAAVGFEDVKDLLPRSSHPSALPEHVPDTPAPAGNDPDDAVAGKEEVMPAEDDQDRPAQAGPGPSMTSGAEPPGPVPDLTDETELTKAQREDLKARVAALLGDPARAHPWPDAVLAKTRELAREAHMRFGTWTPEAQAQPLTTLQARHAAYIRERVAELPTQGDLVEGGR